MKATGIIRRVDDLGRFVIPKEIRRMFDVHEGEPMEIFTSEDGIVLRPYHQHLNQRDRFIHSIMDALHRRCENEGLSCVIEFFDADGDQIGNKSRKSKTNEDALKFIKSGLTSEETNDKLWVRFSCDNNITHHDLNMACHVTFNNAKPEFAENMIRTAAETYTAYLNAVLKE